jgi:hypothetical protein
MARKKGPNTGLIVFAGLGAVVLGGVGAWMFSDVSRAKKEAAEAAANPPTLPAGPLQFVMANSTEATYVALDTVKRGADGLTSATVVKVGRTVASIKDAGPLVSQATTVDCAADRIFDGQSGAFTLDGKLLSAAAGYSGKRGRVVEAGDYQVPALCKGQKGHVVEDIKAALRQSQGPPVNLSELAQANPKDHHNWAWLCAAAARGAWRPEAPDDCNKAVALRPDDIDGRLDRAYLFLKIGRNSEAGADFAKVLAADPKNPVAIYGRSLLTGMRTGGNLAGVAASKGDRCAALALDKDVAGWAARTYQIQMSQEFRVCQA